MVNKPLIRPYFWGGYVSGGGWLTSHNISDVWSSSKFLAKVMLAGAWFRGRFVARSIVSNKNPFRTGNQKKQKVPIGSYKQIWAYSVVSWLQNYIALNMVNASLFAFRINHIKFLLNKHTVPTNSRWWTFGPVRIRVCVFQFFHHGLGTQGIYGGLAHFLGHRHICVKGGRVPPKVAMAVALCTYITTLSFLACFFCA